MNAESIRNLEATHLEVWNERDRSKRDGMLSEIYAHDIRMYDPNTILNGISEVSDFIDKVQTDPEFNFKAVRPMEWTQNGARLFWTIETSKGDLKGMDFFILENGKVAHLYVFIGDK
ncbi:nuclear transport factor 2 family protein [Fluviicola sp.]|uniref:nuclear transport factor 2 family protein n=1 Tax=Fluviicola sp. TaxID=1917219 RepID=UPI003D2DC58E